MTITLRMEGVSTPVKNVALYEKVDRNTRRFQPHDSAHGRARSASSRRSSLSSRLTTCLGGYKLLPGSVFVCRSLQHEDEQGTPLGVIAAAGDCVCRSGHRLDMEHPCDRTGRGAGPGKGRRAAPRDPARELAMKIDAPFTLAAVGDIFGAMAPIVPLQEPRLQDLLKVIRDADVGFANAESSIADLPRFTGPFGGLLAPKAAAADMRAMGIRIVEPGEQPHRGQRRRGDVRDQRAAGRSRDRSRRHGAQPGGSARRGLPDDVERARRAGGH